MSIKNEYLKSVYDGLVQRNPEQKEFLQAAEEVLESLEPVIAAHPEYEKAGLIERMVEPERVVMFRVPWVDDNGKVLHSAVSSRQRAVGVCCFCSSWLNVASSVATPRRCRSRISVCSSVQTCAWAAALAALIRASCTPKSL